MHKIRFETVEMAVVDLASKERVSNAFACPIKLGAATAPPRVLSREVEEFECPPRRTPEEFLISPRPGASAAHLTPDITELIGERECKPAFSRDCHSTTLERVVRR